MEEKDRLRALLKAKGTSQYKFAQDLEVHPHVVQNWFYRSGVPKKRLNDVAKYFGVTTDYILGNK